MSTGMVQVTFKSELDIHVINVDKVTGGTAGYYITAARAIIGKTKLLYEFKSIELNNQGN